MTNWVRLLIAAGLMTAGAGVTGWFFGELACCLVLAGVVTWKLACVCRPALLPAAGFSPESGTFSKRFVLTDIAAYEPGYPLILSAGEDYEQPEENLSVPCWKYEPETMSCQLASDESGVRIQVRAQDIGRVPESLAASVASWLEEQRIVSARASFYGGPYRRRRQGRTEDCCVPFTVQVALTVRRRPA